MLKEKYNFGNRKSIINKKDKAETKSVEARSIYQAGSCQKKDVKCVLSSDDIKAVTELSNHTIEKMMGYTLFD